MSDLSQQIETAASQPKSAQNGDQKVEARPLSELIAADKYLAAKTAAARAPAVVFSKLVPPGAS